MKKYFWQSLLLSFFLQYSYSQKLELNIEISGVNKIKGLIQIGIYNVKESFPKIGKEYRVEYFKVTSNTMNIQIDNLPQNEYSIALFHDINSDGKCNLNFMGIPKEPYGFSNNVRPLLKAPSFELTKIVLNANKKTHIKLIN